MFLLFFFFFFFSCSPAPKKSFEREEKFGCESIIHSCASPHTLAHPQQETYLPFNSDTFPPRLLLLFDSCCRDAGGEAGSPQPAEFRIGRQSRRLNIGLLTRRGTANPHPHPPYLCERFPNAFPRSSNPPSLLMCGRFPERFPSLLKPSPRLNVCTFSERFPSLLKHSHQRSPTPTTGAPPSCTPQTVTYCCLLLCRFSDEEPLRPLRIVNGRQTTVAAAAVFGRNAGAVVTFRDDLVGRSGAVRALLHTFGEGGVRVGGS